MSEEKTVSGPRKLLETALRAVKGDNTQALVENFSAEMTLVAEGLCDDQARLRGKLDELEQRQERDRQHSDSDLQATEQQIRELEEQVEELRRQLQTMQRAEESRQKLRKKEKIPGGLMRSLIILAAIVCGSWVLVTVLQLFK
ncbi:MAG: hypothetical protein IKH38_02800 [Clostridia bacterium]|nr:hypothetical protein [Clostridia bacterium]